MWFLISSGPWAALSTGKRDAWRPRGGSALLYLLRPFPPAHRSLTGSPRSSSESHSPLYLHPPKCTSCGSQSPQHAEMCLHAAGPTFPEELGETQSEYSDFSCGESLPCPGLCSRGLCVYSVIGRSPSLEVHWHLNHQPRFPLLETLCRE